MSWKISCRADRGDQALGGQRESASVWLRLTVTPERRNSPYGLRGIVLLEEVAIGDAASLPLWARPGRRYYVRRGRQVAIQLTPRRFTAGEYHQMIEAGVFAEDERLELIDGEIVQMSPIGDRHAACVRRLIGLLSRLFADRAIVDALNPILVDVAYAPQPDLALLRPRADYYAQQTPTTADCWLVIEVADTSAEFDRQIKAPRYARGGVAELWLIDLERDVVVAYRDPAGDAYLHVQVVHRGETIAIAALGAPGMPVEAILG